SQPIPPAPPTPVPALNAPDMPAHYLHYAQADDSKDQFNMSKLKLVKTDGSDITEEDGAIIARLEPALDAVIQQAPYSGAKRIWGANKQNEKKCRTYNSRHENHYIMLQHQYWKTTFVIGPYTIFFEVFPNSATPASAWESFVEVGSAKFAVEDFDDPIYSWYSMHYPEAEDVPGDARVVNIGKRSFLGYTLSSIFLTETTELTRCPCRITFDTFHDQLLFNSNFALPHPFRKNGQLHLPEFVYDLNMGGMRFAITRDNDSKSKGTNQVIERIGAGTEKQTAMMDKAMKGIKDSLADSQRHIARVEERVATQNEQNRQDNNLRFNAIETAIVTDRLNSNNSSRIQFAAQGQITASRMSLQQLRATLKDETKDLKALRRNTNSTPAEINEAEDDVAATMEQIRVEEGVLADAQASANASFDIPVAAAAIQAPAVVPAIQAPVDSRFKEVTASPESHPATDPFKVTAGDTSAPTQTQTTAPTGNASMVSFLFIYSNALTSDSSRTSQAFLDLLLPGKTMSAEAQDFVPPQVRQSSTLVRQTPYQTHTQSTGDTGAAPGDSTPADPDRMTDDTPNESAGIATQMSETQANDDMDEGDTNLPKDAGEIEDEDDVMPESGVSTDKGCTDDVLNGDDHVVADSQEKQDTSASPSISTKAGRASLQQFTDKASGIEKEKASPSRLGLVNTQTPHRITQLNLFPNVEELDLPYPCPAQQRQSFERKAGAQERAIRPEDSPEPFDNLQQGRLGRVCGLQSIVRVGSPGKIDRGSLARRSPESNVLQIAINIILMLQILRYLSCNTHKILGVVLVLLIPGAEAGAITALAHNVDGLVGDSVKSEQIIAMIIHYLPAMVGLTETHLLAGTASPIWLQQYHSIVNPAEKKRGVTTSGNGGVQMLIRKDLALHGAAVKLPGSLASRACFQDVWLTSANAPPALYRLGVVYGISGQTDPETTQFWAEVSKVLKNGPTNWLITGDANVSLSSAEITAENHVATHASRGYHKFLQDCGGVDAWELDPDRTLNRSWTYKKRGSEIRTLIDRSAASTLPGLFEIGTLDRAAKGRYRYPTILNSDHRPILTTLLIPGLLDTSRAAMPENARPRARFSEDPEIISKYRTQCLQLYELDNLKQAWPTNITDEATFSESYRRVGAIIVPTLKEVFGVAKKVRTERIPIKFSAEVEELNKAGSRLTSLIGAFAQNRLGTMMNSGKHEWAWDLYEEAQSLPGNEIRQQLADLRKQKGKEAYAARKKEINGRKLNQQSENLQSILAGQSAAKVLGQDEAICMQPRVLINPENPNIILTSEEDIKTETRRAFNARFTHDPIPRAEDQKHWMKSKKAQEYQRKTAADPFIWPPVNGIQRQDIDDFLARGSSRPSPGPDEWEKWALKYLPDEILEVITALVDYITRTNYFGDGLNDLLFLTLWKKKGTMVDLNFFRGIGLGNLLHQMAVTTFTTVFKHYAWRMEFLPPTQGAANAGLQGRDLTSYISQIDAWAHANDTTLYWIKRDQKKGYDRVIPEAFDDACKFFGLPDSVRDFVRASKKGLQAFAVTAFGIDTIPIIMEMIMRQGGGFSPNEFTLIFAMASHWVHEEMEIKDPVFIQTKNGRAGTPHTDIDLRKIRVHMPEQMDDSCNIRTSLVMMTESTKMFEDFGRTYGAATDFADASKTEIGILGKDPGELPSKIMIHTEYGDFDVPVTKKPPIFLRTPINDSVARAQECKKIVDDFLIPKQRIGKGLPLAVLIGNITKTLIPKIEARLALQPIKQAQAAEIDTRIAQLIKAYYDWTFSPIADFLNLKLRHQGLNLPSIQDLNAAVAVRGMIRDLNHYIPHLKEMAEMSYAQWQCRQSACDDPMSPAHRTKNRTHRKDIPSHWEVAQQCMPDALEIIDTEQVRLRDGRVSLEHLRNASPLQGATQDQQVALTKALKSLSKVGIHWLDDIARTAVAAPNQHNGKVH
ncbi:hypothetical protein P7C70_g7832, partial [Phenoliferia sp. Uapishka_3]